MRIVCDTNVLLSGILFGGNCRTVIRLVSEGRIDGFTSNALLVEFEGVLSRPKFSLTPEQVSGIIDLVRETFEVVSPFERVEAVPNDPDDNAVLEAALAADADIVVSGDKHLLDLGEFRDIRVIPPARFIAEIGGQRVGGAD